LFPLEAQERKGTLEQVTELGIVASLALVEDEEDEEEKPTSTFYPWSAVLSMRLEA